MSSLAKHKWSIASISLSLVVFLLTVFAGLYYQGQRAQPPLPLALLDLAAVPVAFVTACIALAKEPSRAYAVVALLLSVLSFFCAFSS